MNFWENVDTELEYLGKNRKQLAAEAQFNVSNICKGIKNGNIPSVYTAVKIAQFLGVSVEYLVTGKPATITEREKQIQQDLEMFHSYHKFICKLDELPENIRTPIIEMVEKIHGE